MLALRPRSGRHNPSPSRSRLDRKSTRLNSSHDQMSYAVFCLKKKNFASGYTWQDGIGPKDQRPVRLDLAWNDLESNRFGTDEFLRYCERIATEPYLCINAGLGTIDDARHWVEYCNESRHTFWADQRRKNGRERPYKVKYWALGNEIDGPWQMGHKSAEEYATFALEAAKAMRQVDRDLKLG